MKRLYGAFEGGRIIDVSHSYRAIRRRNPDHDIKNVRETERVVGYRTTTVTYEVVA